LAFARFRALTTTCASISFPFTLKDVSCLSRFLASLLLEVNSKSCSVLEKTSLILFHLSSTVFDCPRALKNTLAGLSLFKGSTISLCFIGKVYSCSAQFGANYSYHSIRPLPVFFFSASLDIKSPNLLKCQRQKEVSEYRQHLTPRIPDYFTHQLAD